MNRIIIAIVLTISNIAYAGIETDKAAGNCVGYLATRQKEAGMRAALAMADNQNRAMQFANTWLNQLERYKNDKSMVSGMVYSASSDCREIGIRPADF